MNYKQLGDTISEVEFLDFVTLIRANTILSEDIVIKNIIAGLYGDYKFQNINEFTILDYGILVTDNSQFLNVQLDNPKILTTYILELKIMSIEDYNLCLEEKKDFMNYSTLTIELDMDNATEIPLSSISDGGVILFNCKVYIRQDKYISKTIR